MWSHKIGPGDFSVMRMLDWPHILILTDSRKTRLTYDLTITQWESGFVKRIQEEKSDAAKECMLDFLGLLLLTQVKILLLEHLCQKNPEKLHFKNGFICRFSQEGKFFRYGYET